MSIYLHLDNRRHLAANITWVRPGGLSLAELAQEHHAQGSVHLEHGDNDIVGLATGLPKGQVYSIAALCALHARSASDGNGAYLLQLPTPDLCLFVGVLDGLPAADAEVVGALSDLRNRAIKFARSAGLPDLATWSNMPEEQAKPISLDDLAGMLSSKTAEAASRIRVSRVTQTIAGLLLLGALCAACYGGLQWWQSKQAAERARHEAAAKKPPQQLYLESLPAAYASAGWSLESANAIVNRVTSIPLERGGWMAERLVCSSNRGGCSVMWTRHLASATYSTFVAATPGGGAGLALAADKITEAIPIASKPFSPGTPLPSALQMLTGPISRLQRLAGTGDAQLTLRDPVPFATVDPQIRPVLQGGASLSGALYLLPMVLSIQDRHISVGNLVLNPGQGGGKPSFLIDLNYYVSKP